MTLHDKIYGLHILGTIFLWGGALLSLLMAKMAVKKPLTERKMPWRISIWAQWLIPIGALALSLSGVGLINEGWGWFLGWLDISILTTLLIIPVVIFRLNKSLNKIGIENAQIVEQQNELPAILGAHYYQIFALLFLGTLLMLLKPGTPMAVLLAAGTFAVSWILQPKH
jgi:hypothetical protein